MNIKPIPDKSPFDIVHIKNGTPHCDKHGAMNKVSVYNGGGYWRCVSAISDTNDNICRAGCIQEI